MGNQHPHAHHQNENNEPLPDTKMQDGDTPVSCSLLRSESMSLPKLEDITHVLKVKIERGQDLKKTDVLGATDSYCIVSMGGTSFRTKVIASQNPFWNQTMFFFLSESVHRGYSLKFSVFDKDISKDGGVGFGVAPIDSFFSEMGVEVNKRLELVENDIFTDKQFNRELSNTLKKRGVIHFSARLTSTEDIENELYPALISSFDSNKDGKIDKNEIEAMLVAMGINLPSSEYEMLWESIDVDHSGDISKDEAKIFLRKLMRSSKVASRAMFFIHEGIDGLATSLMEPVPADASNSEVLVVDRKTGIRLKEHIPTYIKVALKTMYSYKGARYLTVGGGIESILLKLSKRQGEKYDDPSSRKDIPDFVKQHDLNVDEIEKPIDEYKTFNEFFSRSLKPDARPIASPEDESVAVVPADCRMMIFEHVDHASKYWIKGKKFSVQEVLRAGGPSLYNRYVDGSMVIARLSPQDYHRWHIPCSGTLTKRTKVKGALYTVNPIAINKDVDVFTENKREILELSSLCFGHVAMVAVGATMVGSIHILPEDGSQVRKGDQHGYFSFGGSTVLIFFEKDTITFENDILFNSKNNIETLVRVNSRLGVAKQNK